MTSRAFVAILSAFVLIITCTPGTWAQVAGQNVNMVSGTQWPYGDPFLERQNEPSIAVSTRNPLHLLAGANDYRTVDLNLPEAEPGEITAGNVASGEPWVGQYISVDGGARWQSTLLAGYPQDASPAGLASPLHGFTTASDPVIASGTNGLFYYAGIAFDRGSSLGVVFVSRFMDLNNQENGDIARDSFPIRYINTVSVAYGNTSPSQFLDKEYIAADIPRSNRTCTLNVPQKTASGTTTMVRQVVPAGNVYIAYADVATTASGVTSTIYFSRSLDCGATWSTPRPISQGYPLSQGANIQIDPETGIVYVAWRTFHTSTQLNDSMVVAVSLDGGQTFTPGIPFVKLPPFNQNNPTGPSFFDQNTTGASFRSTAYPAMAVADSGIPLIPGPIYFAWAQRGIGPNGDARVMMLAIPGNATITANGFSPPTAFPVDNGTLMDDYGDSFVRGHQLMPAMTFIEGKLMVLYYDLRLDHTEGLFNPNLDPTGTMFAPDGNGNFFEEQRQPVGDTDPAVVFPYYIADINPPLSQRRHTMDVMLSQSNSALVPSFSHVRVSRYDFGLFTGEQSTQFHQLAYNPPNLPMFQKGTVPFIGDYLAIAGQPFVTVKCGTGMCWTFNNPLPPGLNGQWFAAKKPALSSAVHYAGWTSNQNVIAPQNGDWTHWTAIGSGTSVYNGSPLPPCLPGFEGNRDQNVYSSRINQGLLVSSPQSSKPLSSSIERGFVVFVQNATNGRSPAFVNYFRLTIANQPANGFASFQQLVPPSPVPAPPFPAVVNGFPFPLASIDVAIAPHSGIARTVFAVSSSATASILINVTEINAIGGAPLAGGLSGFLLLNADGTVPTNLVDPNGVTGTGSITNVELYDPNITGPNITGPNITGPNITGPNITGPNITGPNITSPNSTGPNITGDTVANPNITGSGVPAPNITGSALSDGNFNVSNTGNTSMGLTLQLAGCDTDPCKSTPLQLIISQQYANPTTDGQCHLILNHQDITLSDVPTPVFTPVNQLGNPNITGSAVSNATFQLAPHDSATVTLRGHVPASVMQQILTQVTPVVVPQAVNSNSTTAITPVFVAPLFVSTSSLPTGTVVQGYPATMLQAIGGFPPYSWSGTAPAGLTLNPNGTLSGTPTLAGSFPFVVTVFDSADNSATRTLTLIVNGNNLTFVQQPTNLTPGCCFSPPVAVKATDAQGAIIPSLSITIALGNNPTNAALTGGPFTVPTDVTGVATFAELGVDTLGTGYTLVASAQGAAATTSTSFDVVLQQPFPVLNAGFSQTLYASVPLGAGQIFGGVGFATNDVYTLNCNAGTPNLYRFNADVTNVVHGSSIHPQASGSAFSVPVGCGLTNHPNGSMYMQNGSGLTPINASTSAPGTTLGPGGDSFGIAVNPANSQLVYPAPACNGSASCDILTVDPTTGNSSTLATIVTGTDFAFEDVDSLILDSTGSYLFVSGRVFVSGGDAPFLYEVILPGGPTQVSLDASHFPDGLAFHTPSLSSTNLVASNNDGTITEYVFSEGFGTAPTVNVIASGGYRGDMVQVRSGCLYVTQNGTNFADGTSTTDNSIVEICDTAGGSFSSPGNGK